MNNIQPECDLDIDGCDVIPTHLRVQDCKKAKEMIGWMEKNGYGNITQ